MKLTSKDINSLYLTLYNRVPEESGQKYWLNEVKAKGFDLKDTANAMLETQASKDFFKGKDSSIDFIDHIYKNLLGKDKTVDPEGVAFWASHIDNGMSKGEVVINMLDAAENQIFVDPAAKKAQQLYHNKLKVAEWASMMLKDVPALKKDGTELSIHEQVKGFIEIGQSVTSETNVLEMIGMVGLKASEYGIQHEFVASATQQFLSIFPQIDPKKAEEVLTTGRSGLLDIEEDGVYEIGPDEVKNLIKEQAKGAPLLTDVWNSIIGSPQKTSGLFEYENVIENSDESNIELSGVVNFETGDGIALVG